LILSLSKDGPFKFRKTLTNASLTVCNTARRVLFGYLNLRVTAVLFRIGLANTFSGSKGEALRLACQGSFEMLLRL